MEYLPGAQVILVRYIAENDEETVFESTPVCRLVLLVDGRESQSFPLRGTVHVGRDKTNSIVVADKKVSRHHATLSAIDDTFILTDMGSANGTYLNGVLISQPTRLKHRDRITFGDTTFILALGSDEDLQTPLGEGPPARVAAVFPSVSQSSLGLDGVPMWAMLGCLGLIVIALLLVVAVLLGLLIGQSRLVGLLAVSLSPYFFVI